MQGTLLFVHGTGVRQSNYKQTLATFEDYAKRSGIEGVTITGVPWGPDRGVTLDRIQETLPPDAAVRAALGLTPLTPAQKEVAQWARLIDDPLFELRLAAQAAPAAQGAVVVNALPPEQDAVARLQRLTLTEADLADTELEAAEVTRAAQAIAGTAELRGAARAVRPETRGAFITAQARAIVATALAERRASDTAGLPPAIAMDGAVRDAFVERLARALAAQEGQGAARDKGWLADQVVRFASPLATVYIEERRASLMGTIMPAVGDILYYQRRGEQIRQEVSAAVAQAARPVVAVGHSLGGVILVDLLSAENAPQVDLLVTMGSQAPLFYALDALDRLRPAQDGAAQLTPPRPWLNIYNRNDFLSFYATQIFAGVADIEDVAVDPLVPFPESHGAYLWHAPVYELIRDRWPKP